jgi:hypothetical protein
MCRNIKKLRQSERIPTELELHEAALQFVRKISGYHHPSRMNQKAFDRAVKSVASVAEKLFRELQDGSTTPRSADKLSQPNA